MTDARTTEPLRRRLGELESERSSWDSHWRDISRFILPRRGRWLGDKKNQGDKLNAAIVDAAGTYALRTLVAGLMSGMTSPARPWFRLSLDDDEAMQQDPIRVWLHEAATKMRSEFARSNLYRTLPQVYEEMAAFGTGAMGLVEGEGVAFRTYAMTVGEYAIAQDADEIVNTLYRRVPMTTAQAVGKFGRDAVSDMVRDSYDNGRLTDPVDVIHAVEPNDDRAPDLDEAENKAFRSIYFEINKHGGKVLRVSGFDEFPFMTPRWSVRPGDAYGRGPGMDALPDIRQLQTQVKDLAKSVAKLNDPPLAGPSSLRNANVNTLPGGITWMDGRGPNDVLAPVYQINPPVQAMAGSAQETRDRISTAFYADLFLMLQSSRQRDMTAREVEERAEEKLMVLGNAYQRMQDELLRPLIDRAFAILARRRDLPPPPPELQGVELKVEFTSVLEDALKAMQVNAVERLSGFIGNLGQVKPEALDKLDVDRAIETYADGVSVDPDVLLDDRRVAGVRQQRAQQQQAQQAMEAAQMGAGAARDLGQAETGNGETALSGLRRALGQ